VTVVICCFRSHVLCLYQPISHWHVGFYSHVSFRGRPVWVLPGTPECPYLLLRLIVWLRWGFLIGLLPVAPKAWRRSTGNKRALNDDGDGRCAVATHLASLRNKGQWPGAVIPYPNMGWKSAHSGLLPALFNWPSTLLML
jgi:hypothetical protein